MDSREHARFVVDREIECRIGETIERVFLYDLSVGGCMVEVSNCRFTVGDAVLVKLTHYIQAHGQVVWQYERNAGVRFEERLPELLVEKLGFQPATVCFEDIAPRDRFGRLLPSLPVGRNNPRLGL